jgi:probable F420-dependent oxidoreductase
VLVERKPILQQDAAKRWSVRVRDIKFGLFLSSHDFTKSKAEAHCAEAEGFYSVSTRDHFFPPMGVEQRRIAQLECYTMLSAIAAVTSRVRLVPTVTAMSFRNPALLAKMISTLDQISGGRFIAGLGSGWLRDEYGANGYPYPSNAQRLEQLEEGIGVMKAMWTQEEPSFAGRYFRIDKAYNFPKPLQKPHPPILIGGGGSKLLQIAARHADIVNLAAPITTGTFDLSSAVKFDKAELKRRVTMLHQYAEAAGRDPGAIEISAFASVSMAWESKCAEQTAGDIARSMGFADANAVQQSPSFLIGTPAEIQHEIRCRTKELGITYYIVTFMKEDDRELFARQVMCEFTS